MRTTPSGTRTSELRARRLASKTGRPPMVKVGARETGLMAKVGEAAVKGNGWLAELGMDYFIDEVAIMLPEGEREAADWYDRMLDRIGRPEDKVTYFNRSRSTVTVHSLPSLYEVEYHFFTSAIEAVRIELMKLGNGHSPLHALYNTPVRGQDMRGRDACIVHASFKLGTELEYRAALAHLAQEGWSCGQDCSSDYGLFSYWRKPDDDGVLLWLKPRVNLRDVPKPVNPFEGEEPEEPVDPDDEPEEFEEDEDED